MWVALAVEKRITLGDLQMAGACGEAQTAFAERFPNGATFRELVEALADHPQGLDWWLWLRFGGHIPPEVESQYSSIRESFRDAYRLSGRADWSRYENGEISLSTYSSLRKDAEEVYLAASREALRRIAETLGDMNKEVDRE